MSIAELPLSPVTRRMTAAEFLALPDEQPCELVKGVIVEMNPPSPRHAIVISNLNYLLTTWARTHHSGLAGGHETALQTKSEPDTVRGIDGFYISFARLKGNVLPEGPLLPAPELCIEVRSPSNRWTDLLEKAVEYLKIGVEEVWLVEPTLPPADRFIESHRLDRDPIRFRMGEILTSPSLKEFQMEVGQAFSGI
ncbi:Uma2 family endonuclease [Planctopirus hydrillae]|uniref:Putative restriction endonuclease domain-containing protein n=1 Tax=Planctopirus hydrillae TaxID=1841610 RepID=A0A1C3ENB4_9PLAN|nr:Uma2 family endonuclease [Planctopirus hydrillae]ODA34724.1 hypothetical protein A6X21_03385 [Planctopirus hydrillae]